MEEIWKPIPGYEGHYEVSNLGRVKGLSRLDIIGRRVTGRILKLAIDSSGYYKVNLRLEGFDFYSKVHRLVAYAFIPNPDNLPQINHKDGIKVNNKTTNLEWSNNRDNTIHAYKNKLTSNQGSSHYNTKLVETDILVIRGMDPYEAAIKFGIGVSTARDIIRRKSWKNVI